MNREELLAGIEKYKSTMTPGERAKKYFSGQEVDHLPYSIHMVNDVVAQMNGYTSTDLRENFEVYKEILKEVNEFWEVAGANVRLSLRSMGAAMGSTLFIPKNGIDHIDHHILQSYEDWDKMTKVDPYNNKILTPMLEKAYKLKEAFPDLKVTTGVVGPMSTAVAIRPVEMVLRDTKKNPDKLKALIDLGVENSLKWVEVFSKEIGKGSASISDPLTCTDILSRPQFEEFSFPYMEKLINGLNEITGAKPSLHVCGHTKGIWKDIKKLNIASFSVDNCEDLSEVIEVLGDAFVVLGNVPPVDVLELGTPEDVIESVKSCIRKGATSKKGYMVASGCQVPLATPKDNLLAFKYAVQKYGRGAKLGHLPKGLEE